MAYYLVGLNSFSPGRFLWANLSKNQSIILEEVRIIKRLATFATFAIIVLLTLALAGCTPGMRMAYVPDTLDVYVNEPAVYSSQMRIVFSGFGFLYIKDMVVGIEIKGENFDEKDISVLIEEIDEFEKVAKNTWKRSESFDSTIPVFMNLGGGILDEDGGMSFDIDSTPWQDDYTKQNILLEMEQAILTLSFTGIEGNTLASSSLTLNFLSR